MFNNLLKSALKVIPKQRVDYIQWLSRAQDERGRWVDVYADPVVVVGSFQAMDTKTAQENGFMTAGRYAKFLTSADIQPVKRDGAPDRVVYGGRSYDVLDVVDWADQDGWKRVFLIEGKA